MSNWWIRKISDYWSMFRNWLKSLKFSYFWDQIAPIWWCSVKFDKKCQFYSINLPNLYIFENPKPDPGTRVFWNQNLKPAFSKPAPGLPSLTVCLLFQIISYDSPRGGVSVITEKGDVTASFLVVQHAKPTDSGTYSCSPSLGDTVSVNVHVLRGNYPFSSVKNKFIFLPFLVIWTGQEAL